MRPGKNTKPIMKRMSFHEMMQRTESLILWPIDEDSHVLRIDRDGEFIFNFDSQEISTPYISRSGDKITYKAEILRFGEWIVHHIDQDRSNNRASNLLWLTYKEHAALHRLLKRGERKQYAALVARIRRENEEDGTEYLEVSL